MQIYELNNKSKTKNIIVDLSNILHLISKNNKHPEIEMFYKLDNVLKSEGYNNPIYIADASLKYKINSKDEFKKLVSEKRIYSAPAKRPADVFILKYAKQLDYFILSNDKFKEYYKEYGEKWINEKRITIMYIDGHFVID
ncbi:MAG: NYN domain-containing protein [Candidatus Helarchaeota archaeon]